jgi:hypothetical protein
MWLTEHRSVKIITFAEVRDGDQGLFYSLETWIC